MLFPHEPVRALTERDHWLINRYRLPPRRGTDYFNALDDDRIPAPNELFAEVDRAYFRQSLQNAVDEWFIRRGFDPEGPTISKHLFEAAFQAEFGQLPPEPVKPVEKYKRYPGDDALVAEAIEGLKSKKFPNAWQAAQALAPRAKGSETAKVHRLLKKILSNLKHLETSQNK